jgi:hypothetical protein
VDLLPASHDCADRTQRDDAPSLAVYELLLDHLLGDGLGQEESAVQVHRLGFQVQLGGQGEEGVEGADPGVGYKGVDPVECPHCRLDDLVSAKDVPASYPPLRQCQWVSWQTHQGGSRLLGNITGDDHHFRPKLLHLLLDLSHLFLRGFAQVMKHEAGSVSGSR